jgi:hypothetical protein
MVPECQPRPGGVSHTPSAGVLGSGGGLGSTIYILPVYSNLFTVYGFVFITLFLVNSGLVLAKQAYYSLSHTSSPVTLFYFIHVIVV